MNYATDRPYDLGHPRHLDQIAMDFPELRIVAGLSGWPWVNEMVALLRRHPNLYCDTASHRPRYFGVPGSGWEQFLQFGNTLLQDKIMVGLSWEAFGMPDGNGGRGICRAAVEGCGDRQMAVRQRPTLLPPELIALPARQGFPSAAGRIDLPSRRPEQAAADRPRPASARTRPVRFGSGTKGHQRVFSCGRPKPSRGCNDTYARARHRDLRRSYRLAGGRKRERSPFTRFGRPPGDLSMAVRYRSPIWKSGSSASPRSLASPVRRGQSEAASELAAAAGPDTRSAVVGVVAVAGAARTPRGALREPRQQPPSPHYATACGGPSFRQRRTSASSTVEI